LIPDRDRKVVIVGGGFAGTTLARRLEARLDDRWDIYLLSGSNVLTYNPLLPEVVGGALLPGHAAAPIRLMLSRTRIRMVTVNDIDPDAQTVRYSGVKSDTLHYDHLVLAAGMTANVSAVPGMAEHSLPLKTLGDALYLRNTIVRRLEEATLTRDEHTRRRLMTFVVIGGGFSGVETAGEIVDLVSSATRFYRNIESRDAHVVLLQSGDRLLPQMSASLGRYALRTLERRGVEVRLNTRAAGIDADSVRLTSGDTVGGATVVSTIGVRAHAFVRESGLPTIRGRLQTESDLRVVGFPAIWAAGDCAAVPNAYDGTESPPTAQFAVQHAETVAANILALEAGRDLRAFSYRPVGQLAAVGHRRAVAEIYGLRIQGLIGWFLWRALYLSKIPTLAAKVRVYFQWTWSMVFPRDLGYLDFRRTASSAPASAPADRDQA